MKLKALILLGGIGLLVFAGSFLASYLLNQPEVDPNAGKNQLPTGASVLAGLGSAGTDEIRPKELQLDNLIKELQQKKSELDSRERQLEKRRDRLAMAQEEVRKQAQELQDLRVQLVAPLTGLKEAKEKLEKTRVVIRREEEANLKKNAETISKMDANSAAEMISRMIESGQAEDAAKTLRYMDARSSGKILAAMADKSEAAGLLDLMKRIRDGE